LLYKHFLVLFLLDLQENFLLLSNPKVKKTRFGVPPFSLLPLVHTGKHTTTFLLVKGKLISSGQISRLDFWADRQREMGFPGLCWELNGSFQTGRCMGPF
jgi:hypothetical protein